MHIVGANRGETIARITVGVALLALVFWKFFLSPGCESAPDDQVQEDFRSLKTKLQLYGTEHDGLPQSFDNLVRPEEGTRKLLNEAPRDPWGGLYQLQVHDHQYDIVSFGPDGQPDSSDDIRTSGEWVPPQR